MSAELVSKPPVIIVPAERPRLWQTIESTASVFFAFLVGFALLTFGGLVVLSAEESPGFGWLLCAWIAAVMAEAAFLHWLKSSLEQGHTPFVPELRWGSGVGRWCFGRSSPAGGPRI